MASGFYCLKDEWMTIEMGKAVYRFRHRIDPAIQLDTWLVHEILINGIIVMSGTDVEGPIKQENTADFTGGIHGDEQFFHVQILADGCEISPCGEVPKTPFDRIDLFVGSHLFFCDTQRISFERHKHLLFADNRVVISNAMTYLGQEPYYVYRWPANGIFSLYKETMNGYTTNQSCRLINDQGTPADKSIDTVSFYGDHFCVTIRSLAAKYPSYLGWVTDFNTERLPRFKAYFDTLDNANGDVVLHQGQEILASYEIWIV